MDPRPLDEVDRKILRALQDNGRLTVAQLSEKVGLSQSPCWTRMKRLEADQYIEGYAAVLNQERLGVPDTVYVQVSLSKHDDETFELFDKKLKEIPEVLEAYMTSGDFDYMIKVAVQGTDGYERFLRERLQKLPNIRSSRSSFALRCLKRMTSARP